MLKIALNTKFHERLQRVLSGSNMSFLGPKCTIPAQNTSVPYLTQPRPHPPLAPPTPPTDSRAPPTPPCHLLLAQPTPTSCTPVPTTNATYPHGIPSSPPTLPTPSPPYPTPTLPTPSPTPCTPYPPPSPLTPPPLPTGASRLVTVIWHVFSVQNHY